MSRDTAMVAKAKAMSSKHLNQDDYRTMIHFNSVGDIAAYLKKHPRYHRVLEVVNEKAIHRDYLEQRIRSQAQYDFNSLLKFMKTDHHHFYEFFIRDIEMNHILFVLHAVEANTKYHLGKFMMDLNYLMAFDVEKLAVCTTYLEVLDVLKDTDYASVLRELKKEHPDLPKIEDQLHAHYNETMFKLIKSSGSHEEILDLFRMKLELNDLSHAYRLKKYFQSDASVIERSLEWTAYKISKQDIHHWLNQVDEQDLLQGIKHSYYGKIYDIQEDYHIEHNFSMILYQILKRKMRISNHPDVILFSYMNLVQIEIENIIDIIEGVRYDISRDEIMSLLIL